MTEPTPARQRSVITPLIRRIIGWTWYPTLLAIAFVLELYARVDVPATAGSRVLFVAAHAGPGAHRVGPGCPGA